MQSSANDVAHTVSLSTDVGEGFGAWEIADDAALLGLVTNANVACGFHAGDPDIMRRTSETCARNGVLVGAQVSYRDLVGFGRRHIAVPKPTLVNDLIYQLGALDAFTRVAGTELGYVRAHGALYNVAATDPGHAEAIVEAVSAYDGTLPLFCQPGTTLWHLAEQAGLVVVAEGFVDRAYTPEGLLVPRSEPDAMITDPAAAAQRAVRMVQHQEVEALDGRIIPLRVQTLLVHSDTVGSVEIARATRDALLAAGVRLTSRPWAG